MFWRICAFIVGVLGITAAVVMSVFSIHFSADLPRTWENLLLMGCTAAAIVVCAIVSTSMIIGAMWKE